MCDCAYFNIHFLIPVKTEVEIKPDSLKSIDSIVVLLLIKSKQLRFLLQQNVVPKECHCHWFNLLCFEASILYITSTVFEQR